MHKVELAFCGLSFLHISPNCSTRANKLIEQSRGNSFLSQVIVQLYYTTSKFKRSYLNILRTLIHFP